ncbi:MAG: LPS assembly protein LptD, partial [Gammaproteobacteria bacterium]|nr:LPS assembly protein LptD [Gammaproteobacteria bacterium]
DNISRLVLNPQLSLPITRSYGHFTPALGLFGSLYQTENQRYSNKQWYFHTSGALYLDRQSSSGSQSLIPHFSYLNMPYTDQSQLPLIDSNELPMLFDTLFYPRRFSGWDRFGDLHRFSWGLKNQWNNQQGQQLASIELAHARILSDQKQSAGISATPLKASDDIGALRTELNFSSSTSISGEILSINQVTDYDSGTVILRYAANSDDQLELRHDFRSNYFRQTSFIYTNRLNSRWRIATRGAYSNKHKRIREGLVGLEYNNCCWSLRFVARRYANVLGEAPKNAVAVQFELKGLTSIGSRLEDTFSKELFGIQ